MLNIRSSVRDVYIILIKVLSVKILKYKKNTVDL